MNKVIAALDTSAAGRPVLQGALRLAQLIAADVEAVHVAVDPDARAASDLARLEGIRLRLLNGPVEREVLAAVESPDVVAAVLGARATSGGRRPVGHVTSHVLRRTTKPVVVVPPSLLSPRPFRRLLVPLEGVEADSEAIARALSSLKGPEVEVVVLHVFTDATLPRMLDRPTRDLSFLGAEFAARHLPEAAGVELRTGPVAPRVTEVSTEQGADLVVLAWSQVATAGRARVIREVLGACSQPVLLIPLRSVSSRASARRAPARSGEQESGAVAPTGRGSRRPLLEQTGP